VLRKLLRTPCEVFFLQFKKTRTAAELWRMYVVGEFLSPKALKNFFFQNFKNPPPSSFKLQRSMHQARTPCNFYLVS
jgi:hypothetical protein